MTPNPRAVYYILVSPLARLWGMELPRFLHESLMCLLKATGTDTTTTTTPASYSGGICPGMTVIWTWLVLPPAKVVC